MVRDFFDQSVNWGISIVPFKVARRVSLYFAFLERSTKHSTWPGGVQLIASEGGVCALYWKRSEPCVCWQKFSVVTVIAFARSKNLSRRSRQWNEPIRTKSPYPCRRRQTRESSCTWFPIYIWLAKNVVRCFSANHQASLFGIHFPLRSFW